MILLLVLSVEALTLTYALHPIVSPQETQPLANLDCHDLGGVRFGVVIA